MSSSSAPSVSSKISPKKYPSDRHRKVEGRDRRVLLSPACTRLLSEISIRLGHRTMGETIQWLMVEAKPSVDAVLGHGSSYPPPSQLMVFPSSNPTFGFSFPTMANTAQIPTSMPDPSLAIYKDHRLHDTDPNISSEMIEKFFSEFSL